MEKTVELNIEPEITEEVVNDGLWIKTKTIAKKVGKVLGLVGLGVIGGILISEASKTTEEITEVSVPQLETNNTINEVSEPKEEA